MACQNTNRKYHNTANSKRLQLHRICSVLKPLESHTQLTQSISTTFFSRQSFMCKYEFEHNRLRFIRNGWIHTLWFTGLSVLLAFHQYPKSKCPYLSVYVNIQWLGHNVNKKTTVHTVLKLTLIKWQVSNNECRDSKANYHVQETRAAISTNTELQ